jgi:hypothetical protein
MQLATRMYKTSNIMKHYVTVCAFFLMAIFISVSGFAQTGDPAARAAQMKQKLITELKMTDVQADSVVAINMSYRPQMRDIFQDQTLSQDEKKTKMKAITDLADKRIQPVLGDPLFKQYQEWRAKNMQQMRAGKAGNS